jgi:hypothetical protein
MIEIAAAVSIASSAFKGIKKAMDTGREAQDLAQTFGKFFDAKDQIIKASQDSQNQPVVNKLFNGTSVESQALEVTAAKHKIAQLEKDLREYLVWSGQGAFYNDMMSERRRIHSRNVASAKKAAEDKKFIIDLCTIGVATLVALSAIYAILSTLIDK